MNAAPPPGTGLTRSAHVALWLGGIQLAPCLLFGLLWWWVGSEGSLHRALRIAQRWLPENQQLAFTDVQGSISGGGHIGQLQWSKPGTALTVEELRLDWSLRQLFSRELQVRALSIRRIQLRSTPQPDQPEEPPFKMPADVALPIRLTVPLDIGRVEIASVDAQGNESMQALDDIAVRYRYEGAQHALRIESLHYGRSQLQAAAQLQAKTLALTAQLDASLRDLVPDTPFAMQARFTVQGNLADGDAALLDAVLDAQQQDVPPAAAAGIQAQASIHPWRSQPAQQVDVQLSRFNAHAFHAQAPVTALHGSASVRPAEGGNTAWNAAVDITNDRPGAWDRQQLPLRQFALQARLSLQQVNIETARVELGGAAPAGIVMLNGQVPLQQPTQATLQLDLQQVDLRPLMSSLPATSFSGAVTVKPWQQDDRQIEVDIRNASPGPLGERLPAERLLADLRVTPAQWHIETIDLQIGAGHAQVRGDYAPGTQALDLRGELQRLPLRQIHRRMANDFATLSGKLSVAGTLQQGLDFAANVASDAPEAGATAPRGQWEIHALETSGRWSPTRLIIERLHADAFDATADGSGIDVSLPRMDAIQANFTAAAPGVQLSANTAMQQQSGGGKVSLQLASAEQVETWLRSLPFIGERMPPLHAQGAAHLDAEWQGGWRQWVAGIGNPAAHPQLKLDAVAHTDGVHIDLPATASRAATRIEVQQLDLNAHGNLAAATLAITGDGRANAARAVLEVRMSTTQQSGAGGAPRWNIAVEKFAVTATLPDQAEPWQLLLSDNLQVVAQTGADLELRATAGSATISAPASSGAAEPLQLAWQPVLWRRTAAGAMTLQSTGTVSGLQPAWLDTLLAKSKDEGPLTTAGIQTDLSLRGEWDARMTDRVNIRAHLQRERGDVMLVDARTSAGLRALDITVQAADENVLAELNWDSANAGVITASMGTRLTRQADGWALPPTAPLSGAIDAKLPDLATLAFLVPPGWRVQGALDANVKLGGTLRQPLLTGGIAGHGLNVRSVLDGLDLHDGKLRASLHDSRMEIAELTFEGGTGSRAYVRGFGGNRTASPKARGSMNVQGSIDWSRVANAPATETGIVMDLAAKLDSMQVLVRHDRQMTLSGGLSARLDDGQLQIRGNLKVNRASIVLPEASAPTLGDDVVILRNVDLQNPSGAEARQALTALDTRKPLDMEINLDLGNDLALEGEGITTRLEGELTVRSARIGSNPFNVFGEVRTVEGRYRAWGQALDIETGIVRFNGSYDNPALELLAIRPQIEVRAGVHVTGTLLNPRVQLFSDPELPEGEKLSWVVLGRATVVTGAEGTSMQQAALGLAAGQLSGRLASGLGVDELGLSESGVSVGKRLSNELYLTYQQGLAGAASTLFIFYDITRRLTVRAQASEASAVDLVYTIKYD